MIFHLPDANFTLLSGMCKRCASFGAPGRIDPTHPLAAAWSNVQLMNSAWDEPKATVFGDCLYPAMEFVSIEMTVDMRYLDWFAGLVDRHASRFLLAGDESFAAICYEWVRALWFLPPGLPAGVVARLQEIRT